MKVLIVQNITREGPGLLGEVIEKRGIGYDIADLSNAHELPGSGGYGAIVVLGGPDSANDKTAKMIGEIALIRKTLHEQKPYLGICLGMQALVKAAGGEVYRAEAPEAGWRDKEGGLYEIGFTSTGGEDPVFKDTSGPINIFHLHGETVSIAPGTTLLATGKYCLNQAVRVGERAYGFQGHLELTEKMLPHWIAEDPGLGSLGRARLIADYNKISKRYTANGRRIFGNFLDIAGL